MLVQLVVAFQCNVALQEGLRTLSVKLAL